MARDDESVKYLVFRLEEAAFAVPLLRVVEIAEMPHVTPVPQASRDLLGLATVRGRLVPVVDLRRRFGMPEAATNRETCLVVVEGASSDGGGPLTMGWRVDKVQDVTALSQGAVTPTPAGAAKELAFLSGMAAWRDGKLLLLDPDKTVEAAEGLGALRAALDERPPQAASA